MATVKEILNSETQKKKGDILLFEEGLFLKAYEQSAFALHSKWKLKPTCKYVKTVDQLVVSVGFPKMALKNYFPDAELSSSPMVVTGEYPGSTSEEVTTWKNSLAGNELKHDETETDSPVSQNVTSLRKELLLFPLESSSPMQCMLFLSEIKNRIHAGEI